jgi:hypothetical protein
MRQFERCRQPREACNLAYGRPINRNWARIARAVRGSALRSNGDLKRTNRHAFGFDSTNSQCRVRLDLPVLRTNFTPPPNIAYAVSVDNVRDKGPSHSGKAVHFRPNFARNDRPKQSHRGAIVNGDRQKLPNLPPIPWKHHNAVAVSSTDQLG